MMMMMMYVASDVMVFSIDLASISHYRRSCPIVQEDRAILYLCIHSAESYFRLFSTGVVTVRDEYLLFVKVILMMSIRVMRASADVTHSLAVAGAVLSLSQGYVFCDHIDNLFRVRVYDTTTFTLLNLN